MSEEKRFYWIKLKTDFFDLPTIDWLQEQKNGCEYIVLYQKLCLLASNTGGTLVRKVGEMIIPYDVRKISEVTRFKYDTVIVAMELYKKIGLIFEEGDGVFTIANFENMVGSESKWAEKKRLQRDNKKDKVPKLLPKKENTNKDNSEDFVPQSSEKNPPTLSDKRLESRDKSIEIDNISTTIIGASVTEIYRSYADNIHPITGQIEADRLAELTKKYGVTWVLAAIQRAVLRNKRSLGYIEGILKGWDTNGFDDGEANGNGQRSAGNHKPYHAKGKKSETDWSKETGGW